VIDVGAAAGSRQPLWADSKQLYKPGSGLGAIERGVLAALAATALASTAPTSSMQRASHGIPSDGAALSEREIEVLRYVGKGFAKKQIAEMLGISVKTVDKHVTSVMEKLDIHDRVELALYAVREGFITP
jgi:DNA-binding NarL/FixJ family response regulator